MAVHKIHFYFYREVHEIFFFYGGPSDLFIFKFFIGGPRGLFSFLWGVGVTRFIFMGVHEIDTKSEKIPGSKKFLNYYFRQHNESNSE